MHYEEEYFKESVRGYSFSGNGDVPCGLWRVKEGG